MNTSMNRALTLDNLLRSRLVQLGWEGATSGTRLAEDVAATHSSSMR